MQRRTTWTLARALGTWAWWRAWRHGGGGGGGGATQNSAVFLVGIPTWLLKPSELHKPLLFFWLASQLGEAKLATQTSAVFWLASQLGC